MRRLLSILGCLAALSVPVIGHHAFGGEFDPNRPVLLKGKVTKVEWVNPHVHIYVDSKAEDGTVTTWDFELGSPNGLLRHGWTRNSLKPGGMVTIEGFRARDGSNLASGNTVTFNGTKMFLGPAKSDAPAK